MDEMGKEKSEFKQNLSRISAEFFQRDKLVNSMVLHVENPKENSCNLARRNEILRVTK